MMEAKLEIIQVAVLSALIKLFSTSNNKAAARKTTELENLNITTARVGSTVQIFTNDLRINAGITPTVYKVSANEDQIHLL